MVFSSRRREKNGATNSKPKNETVKITPIIRLENPPSGANTQPPPHNPMKTKTIFRTFRKTGEVIALFPEIPADVRGTYCGSYMHVGQHGGAYPGAITGTRPATAAEIAPLAAELARIGYDIETRRKITPAMEETRRRNASPTPPFPITLIGDPGHKEKQAELVRNLTTRPAWKLSDCTFTA